MKGQYSIMEYLFMMIFVIIIIIIFVFLIFGYQITQLQFQESSNTEARLISASTRILNSPFFVKEDSMFDDAKLKALLELDSDDFDVCQYLHKSMGFEFFVRITDIYLVRELPVDQADPYKIELNSCKDSDYGEVVNVGVDLNGDRTVSASEKIPSQCNYWEFCYEEDRVARANVIPVNIYRRFGRQVSTGVLPNVNLGRMVIGIYV